MFLGYNDEFRKVFDIVFDIVITDLKSIRGKYMEEEVIYPFDLSFINLPSKPASIIERMKKSYLNINSSISLDEMDFIYQNSNDIYGFVKLFSLVYKDDNKVAIGKEVKIKEKGFLSLFRRVK